MLIKNRDVLETSELHCQVLDLLETGLKSVLPDVIMRSALSIERNTRSLIIKNDSYPVKGRLFVIGGGKAAGLMAQTLEEIIGSDVITAGLVIDKAPPESFDTSQIKVRQAGHPLPDYRGIEATREMLALKSQYRMGADDIVLCLISGGGSALMPAPFDLITLREKQAMTSSLLACGASIDEINVIRKHLSQTKGGRLAQHFTPSQVISLILSDVIGNDLSVIASGPCQTDPTTFSQAAGILNKYELTGKIPNNILDCIEKGCRGELPETPKVLDNVHNYIIGDINTALQTMADKSISMGRRPLIVNSQQCGDTEDTAHRIAGEIKSNKFNGYNVLLIGGEMTVRLPENAGQGGRNQHYAAVTLCSMQDLTYSWVAASLGTDGTDYMAEAAGAVVDNRSLTRILAAGIDPVPYIKNCNSHALLSQLGDSLIVTGPTGTNVGDLIVYLLEASQLTI